MKYLITESQIDKIVYKYLDNQDFIQIDRYNTIYFTNSEEDEYCQLLYHKNNGVCTINNSLIDEISTFFSIDENDSVKIICRWVGSALKMSVLKGGWDSEWSFSDLRM